MIKTFNLRKKKKKVKMIYKGNILESIWLVCCFQFNDPLRQYFSLNWAISQREGERRQIIDERNNVQTNPTRAYCKNSRSLPFHYPN